MTFDESIPVAQRLAESALAKGFDATAFIILCEIQKLSLCQTSETDEVPESNIDDSIKLMLKFFVSYYNEKSVDTLKQVLDTIKQVVSELYHTCNSENEVSLIQEFVGDLADIL
jgi:hypothetical protein